MTQIHSEAGSRPVPDGGSRYTGLRAYSGGVFAVVGMEMRQRLRSRGWYIMLALWFLVIGIVTALTWWSWQAQQETSMAWDTTASSTGPGPLIFEIVLAFVLLFGLLVAPAFSANAINGDRAGGTLAILQVTLLSSGQILWGKFLASWIAGIAFLAASIPFLVFAIVQGGLGFGHIAIALLMLAVEIAVVCALGVGISALANRPLFSIVVTYLVVSVLVFGTLIAFGLGAMVSQGKVQANQMGYAGSYGYDYDIGDGSENPPPLPSDVTDRNGDSYCFGPIQEVDAVRTDRVAWMLGMNPFVVIADAIPYQQSVQQSVTEGTGPTGIFEMISQGARYAQAGPEATYTCANGKLTADYMGQKTPLWPLGLGLQLVVAAGVVALGWRALRTPAGKLPKGTRVA
ncbi:ABC transporter permease [Arthrobacter sp. TMN-49]